MLAKREAENTNDQFIFVAMVRDAGIEPVTSSPERMRTWRACAKPMPPTARWGSR